MLYEVSSSMNCTLLSMYPLGVVPLGIVPLGIVPLGIVPLWFVLSRKCPSGHSLFTLKKKLLGVWLDQKVCAVPSWLLGFKNLILKNHQVFDVWSQCKKCGRGNVKSGRWRGPAAGISLGLPVLHNAHQYLHFVYNNIKINGVKNNFKCFIGCEKNAKDHINPHCGGAGMKLYYIFNKTLFHNHKYSVSL